MTLHVTSSDQWEELSRNDLDVVVDPMVVRCGEVFLKGAAGAENPAQAWSFLERNVGALSLFFDTLILEKNIPVFNYGDTYDLHLDFDKRVLAEVNDIEPVLFDVDVKYDPYWEVKNAALDELRKLYKGPQTIPFKLANDIVSEMAAAGYQWTPSLGGLEKELPTEVERKLAHFFLGGLIFGGYAQVLD
jgi:hypothetical protein